MPATRRGKTRDTTVIVSTKPKLLGRLQDRKEHLARRIARKRLTSEQTQCHPDAMPHTHGDR